MDRFFVFFFCFCFFLRAPGFRQRLGPAAVMGKCRALLWWRQAGLLAGPAAIYDHGRRAHGWKRICQARRRRRRRRFRRPLATSIAVEELHHLNPNCAEQLHLPRSGFRRRVWSQQKQQRTENKVRTTFSVGDFFFFSLSLSLSLSDRRADPEVGPNLTRCVPSADRYNNKQKKGRLTSRATALIETNAKKKKRKKKQTNQSKETIVQYSKLTFFSSKKRKLAVATVANKK